MANLCAEYSGIVLNQNARTGFLLADFDWHYQTFRFPENYTRGEGEQIRCPSLSGFQILVKAKSTKSILNYTIERYNKITGRSIVLAKGFVNGVQATGVETWMDVILDKEIEITPNMVSKKSLFRIGFQSEYGIEAFCIASPNPLREDVEAYQSDGKTPLSPSASFAFRILGLTADSGTDFIGDPYRSVVINTRAEEANGQNNINGYWLSSPQPSEFAVISHYTDLRPVPVVPSVGFVNLISNPSFEYDKVGSNPAIWKPITAELIVAEEEEPEFAGERRKIKDLKITTEGTGRGTYVEAPLVKENSYTFSAYVMTEEANFNIALVLGTEETKFEVKKGIWERVTVSFTPNETKEVRAEILAKVAGKHIFFVKEVMINKGSTATLFFDGDNASCQWSGQKGHSPSVEYVESAIENEGVVVDSVLIDPLTPGVGFNLYYTNDLRGSESEGEMTEEDWEQKLWIHIPQTYVTSVKTTYVLPEPIKAKFMKVEFSNLQARAYNPGDFQRPVKYKIFPEWVALPFLAELTLPNFVARKVGVAYDALELLYKPLIEDLIQAPNSPLLPSAVSTILPNPNNVDATTLAQIDLTVNSFLDTPSGRVDSSTLIGQHVTAQSQKNYPVEVEASTPRLNFFVSNQNRQAVVFDQSYPVMFFWVTCRHEYKEQFAELEYNRAYFAGLKEVAFLRESYTTTSDKEFYIEPGGDDLNVERNEFFVNEGEWFTYDV